MKLLLFLSMVAALHAEEIVLWPNGAPGSEGKTEAVLAYYESILDGPSG